MTRKEKFKARYGVHAPTVLSSIARVARAGRTGNPNKIAKERFRHYVLMNNLARASA